MAFNPAHAKRMRGALEGSSRVVQVGIQSTSGATVEKARPFEASLHAYLDANPALEAEILEKKELTDDIRAKIKAAIMEARKRFDSYPGSCDIVRIQGPGRAIGS